MRACVTFWLAGFLLTYPLGVALGGEGEPGAGPQAVGDSIPGARQARSDSILSRLKGTEGAVTYWGDVIESRMKEHAILIMGEAGISFGEATLRADSIRYDYDRGELKATGSPVLEDLNGVVKGKRMGYRLDEKKGVIKEGSTSYDKWLFKGKVISKVGDRDIYGKDSRFTTCDLEKPHYHFSCSRLKLTIGDKVIARSVVFYVRDIPVFFIPFYIFPIQTGRKSGFLRPKFGIFNDGRRGRSVTDLGYFFALSDYFDFTVASDIYENARWSLRGEGRYARRYKYRGNVFYSFIDDARTLSRRSLLRFRHEQTLNRETNVMVEGNFASDRRIYSDNSYNIDEVLQRSLKSRATYNRRASWGSWYLTGYNDFSLERDRTKTQLPIFSLSKSASPLFSGVRDSKWSNGISYGLSTRFESTHIKDQEDITTYQAARTDLDLSDPLKLWGFLNMTPRLRVSQSSYHNRKGGTGFLHQEVYEGSLSLFTRLYGIFKRPAVGPLTRWRHTLSPQVTYHFRPDFDSSRFSGLTGFPGVTGEANSFGLSLTNDFDAKYLDGGKEKQVSLFSLVQSTSYSLVKARQEGQSGWGDLSTRLESRPNRRFNLSIQMSHSLFDGETFDPFLSSSTISMSIKGRGHDNEADSLASLGTAGLNKEGNELSEIVSQQEYAVPREIGRLPWSLSLTHTLSRSRMGTGPLQSLYGTISFNPTRKWRLTYAARYNVEEGQVQNQRLILRRDLHRWEMLLSFSKLPGNRLSYEMRVNLIDLPALEIKRAIREF